MHAAVPVDIRTRLPEGIKPEAGEPGNCFGTVFVPLPVDGESALERLFRIKHETRKLKKSWQPGLAWGLTACASLLPDIGRKPLADLFFRKASAVVSNVPGTPETRYLAGCPITEQMFWVPQAGNIGDRKSTRLNSSHVRISYAVFCLKKKKDKITSVGKRCRET